MYCLHSFSDINKVYDIMSFFAVKYVVTYVVLVGLIKAVHNRRWIPTNLFIQNNYL